MLSVENESQSLMRKLLCGPVVRQQGEETVAGLGVDV